MKMPRYVTHLTIIFQFINELINEQSIDFFFLIYIYNLPQTGATRIAKPTPNGIRFIIAYIYIVLRMAFDDMRKRKTISFCVFEIVYLLSKMDEACKPVMDFSVQCWLVKIGCS